MNAGRLNTRVTLQRQAISLVAGQTRTVWTDVAEVWAEILPRASREAFRASRVEGALDYLVRIRWRDDLDLTSDCRVLWGVRPLEIVGPPQEITLEGDRLAEMSCREVEE